VNWMLAAVKHTTLGTKHRGRYRNGRRRGRHSLLLHRPLIGGGRKGEPLNCIVILNLIRNKKQITVVRSHSLG
jgi:hypothetical protein